MATTNLPEDLKSRVKDSYDAVAHKYADTYQVNQDTTRMEFIDRVFARLKASGATTINVLELGCGAGTPATRHMLDNKELSVHVTGNDISTTQITLARANLESFGDRATLVEGDMHALSLPGQTFDMVAGFFSIIHLPREEQTSIVAKIATWLKPGGFLLANFSTTNSEVMHEEKWMNEDKGWMFWSGWGEEGSVKMVEDAGFAIEERDVRQLEGDAEFVWIVAQKKAS